MPKVPAAPFSPTRREILQGAAVAAGAILLDGCHGGPAPASAARLAGQPMAGGLEVSGTRLTKDGKPFFVSGINYWAGTTLARDRTTPAAGIRCGAISTGSRQRAST